MKSAANRARRRIAWTGRPLACALALLAFGAVQAGEGDPDPTFSLDGRAYARWAGNAIGGVRIAADAGGRVFVGASVYRDDDAGDFCIARFRANGSLDTTFGFQGYRTVGVDFVENGADTLSGLFPLADGKLMLLGSADVDPATEPMPAMIRLDAAGNADPAFGTNGRRVQAAPTAIWSDVQLHMRRVARQADGKFVFAGFCDHCAGEHGVVALRVDAEGDPDPDFGIGGWASIAIDDGPVIADVQIDARGRIVLAGMLEFGAAVLPMIVRMTPAGVADATFSGDGVAFLTSLPDTVDSMRGVTAIAPARDGSLYLALANVFPGAPNNTGVVHLRANGTLDTAYGADGLLDLTQSVDTRIATLALRGDGRLVAAGRVRRAGAENDVFVARALPDGTLDAAFSGNGLARVDTGMASPGAEAMVLVANKPLIAGYAFHDGDPTAAIVRLDADLIFGDGLETTH